VLGWLVGYAERGEDITIFAMNMDLRGPADLMHRMPIVRGALEKIGAI
jgi:beta-lactamase class D